MDCLRRACSSAATAVTAAPRPGFEFVGPLSSLPQRGLIKHVLNSGVPLCIVSDRTSSGHAVSAISDECPHKAASLSSGDIEEAGGALSVICPKHRKKYDGGLHMRVSDGSSWVACVERCTRKYDPTWRVAVYDVDVSDEGGVYVSSAPREGTARVPSAVGYHDDEELASATPPLLSATAASIAAQSAEVVTRAFPPDVAMYERAAELAALPPRGLAPYTLMGGPHAGVRLCVVVTGDAAARAAVHALYDTCPHKQAQVRGLAALWCITACPHRRSYAMRSTCLLLSRIPSRVQLSLGDIEDGDASKGVCVRCPRHRWAGKEYLCLPLSCHLLRMMIIDN